MRGIPLFLLVILLAACQSHPAAPTPPAAIMPAATATAAPPNPTGSATAAPALTNTATAVATATPTGVPPTPTSEPSPSPTAGTPETFISEAHGFSLVLPPGWTPVTTLVHRVSLVRAGTGIALRIWVKHADDEINLVRTGVGAGDLVERDPVLFLGQPVSSQRLVYQDRDKAVFYELATEIPRDDLIFVIALETNQSDYEAVDIPLEIQAEADAIVSSLELLPPGEQPSP